MEAKQGQMDPISGSELKAHIQGFLADYSIETTTHDEMGD